MNLAHDMKQIAERARAASRVLAGWTTQHKNDALRAMAEALRREEAAILAANQEDVEAGRAGGLSDAMIDRLTLNHDRLEGIARAVEDVAALPDPVGEVMQTHRHPNGMSIERVRVPLGVVLMIYESRPNVTADAAALALKAGNAAILRGGSEAMRTNVALHAAITSQQVNKSTNQNGTSRTTMAGDVDVLTCGLVDLSPIQLITTTDRAAVRELLQLEGLIDLVIPRGGEGLIRAVAEHSRIPVLKHYKGVCHVYVDAAADLEMAQRIIVNAKCQRPGVCNAAETLLVHEHIAEKFLPRAAAELIERGVELRCDEGSLSALRFPLSAPSGDSNSTSGHRAADSGQRIRPATEDDWRAEYLALILAVRVVKNLDEAIDHIERYGSRHSDAIVTEDEDAAERFLREVDSAAVYVNASTRFTDGGEFGLGAEIGVSTDKLHARGPCGIESLTTYKYVCRGTGQVRG